MVQYCVGIIISVLSQLVRPTSGCWRPCHPAGATRCGHKITNTTPADRPEPFQRLNYTFSSWVMPRWRSVRWRRLQKTSTCAGAANRKPTVKKPYGTSVQLCRYLWGRVPDVYITGYLVHPTILIPKTRNKIKGQTTKVGRLAIARRPTFVVCPK